MTTVAALPEQLHYLMIRRIVETGHVPDLSSLAALAGRSEEETECGLRQLEEMHGVILVPNSFRVWSLHPFALMPTRFWVTAGARGWWANCAWCALGIGAALGEEVTVSTAEGAEVEALEFRIHRGRATRSDLLLHFPYPPARWWDNPYSPCGNILFFTAQPNIAAWCQRHGHPQGAILDIDTGMRLAECWFGDYASPEWRRKTPGQADAIFKELKLDPSFWTVPGAFR